MGKEDSSVEERAVSSRGSEDQLVKTKRADDVLSFVADLDTLTWTPQEERKVVRKIDAVILALLFGGAALGYADAQAFGCAAIFGLIKDMKLYTLVPGQFIPDLHLYSLAAAMPQLGAIVAPFPLLILAQHFSYGRSLGIVAIFTGVVTMLTIVCTNPASIFALRFFTGFTSIVGSLAVIVTAMWWKTEEQPLRVGCYIAGSAMGNLIGQAVDLGAVDIVGGPYEESPWKYIYVILGSVAIAYGLIATFAFPSSPMKAWFLTDREKAIAVRRLAGNQTGIQTRVFKWAQVGEAFLDPQMYLLGIFSFAFSFANNALGSFGLLLFSSFGFSPKRSIVLSMPISAIAVVCMLLSGYLGTKFPRRRVIIAMAFIMPSIAGNAILWKAGAKNLSALLGGLYISATFYGTLIQGFALIAANCAGHTKKTTINAVIVVVSNLGGFAGPFAYKASEALEHFPTGQISALSLLSFSLAALGLLLVYYNVQNKRKAAQRTTHAKLLEDPNLAFMDLTDMENPAFVYST